MINNVEITGDRQLGHSFQHITNIVYILLLNTRIISFQTRKQMFLRYRHAHFKYCS